MSGTSPRPEKCALNLKIKMPNRTESQKFGDQVGRNGDDDLKVGCDRSYDEVY